MLSHSRDVLNNLETGMIRYISMISTGRRIRLLSEDVAIVHGSEEDEVEQSGRRFPVRYVYMDVVVKRKREMADRRVTACVTEDRWLTPDG